ncbi:MAG: hypothetical protein HC876_22510, partial [Chloroflexaceae bacterium]|nr:hypothetical protein [Chloroflexaceae bacterium]
APAPAPAQRPAPAPSAAPRRQGPGFFRRIGQGFVLLVRLVLLLVVLATVAAGITYVFVPGVLPTIPALEEFLEPLRPQPPPPVLQATFISREITINVSADADEATILESFREAYRAEIALEYPDSVISSSVSITVNSWDRLENNDDFERYRSTVTGFVQISQP